MAKHRKRKPKPNQSGQPIAKTAVTLRRAAGGWELVPPRCAKDRAEDLEEVHSMLELGETEVAVEEIRWLLSECPDFIDAHRLLGELALTDEDLTLARAHFGYAYTAGNRAIPQQLDGLLPHALAANQPFFESAKGLVFCLVQLGKQEMAEEVAARMLQLDPDDPLGIKDLTTDHN